MPTSVSALLLAKMKNCVLCFLLENYKQIMPVMGRDILCSDDDNDVEVSLRNYAKKNDLVPSDIKHMFHLCDGRQLQGFPMYCKPTS